MPFDFENLTYERPGPIYTCIEVSGDYIVN